MAVTQELQEELPGSIALLANSVLVAFRKLLLFIVTTDVVCVSCELSLEDYELVFDSCTFAMNFVFTFVNFRFVSFRPHNRNETKYVDTCVFL